MFELYLEFYKFFPRLFVEDKEPENYFSYKSFTIQNYRGLKTVSINFSKNDLVLLLGLNESGKTSILEAIECFDFTNDPHPKHLKSFFTDIRNKQDLHSDSPCIITASIEFDEGLPNNFFNKVLRSAGITADAKAEAQGLIKQLNEHNTVRISRVIPFIDGNARRSFYEFEGVTPFSDKKIESILAQEIVRRCPFILYFEDFQDLIPDKIYANTRSDAFNYDWYEIIDGLFYNTDTDFSIKKYLGYYSKNNRREDDASTVLNKVNKTLNDTFTEKWLALSGVKEIDKTELTFQEDKKTFAIKIAEKDGTTYSVHERSKGAVWYLAFLMKTEFRRKKLRQGSGRPIYLIDEPASNLHSTAQKNMVDDFFKLVEDTTLIYTTHSQYLVSRSNVKNTYIVQRSDGVISCTKWGEFIKGEDANVTYYQPLHDCLDLVPNSFDIPWDKAIITEGPSDSFALELLQLVLDDDVSHVIYPGSSASNLSTLISLNMGWGAEFKILLDSDDEGMDQKDRYMEKFSLPEDSFVMLPKAYPTIEKMLNQKELRELYTFATGSKIDNVNKKQFLELMRALVATGNANKEKITSIISSPTKKRFAKILHDLKMTNSD